MAAPGDGGGKYVIKKNNFIMNRRPASRPTGKSIFDESEDNDRKSLAKDAIYDTMDLGDLDNLEPEAEQPKDQGSQSTVKMRRGKPKLRLSALGDEAALYRPEQDDDEDAGAFKMQRGYGSTMADRHQRTVKRPLNVKDSALQMFSKSKPLKTTTVMNLRPNRGYFVPEDAGEDEELSRAINTVEPVSHSRPVLGLGEMRVIRKGVDQRASQVERQQIESHIVDSQLKTSNGRQLKGIHGSVPATTQGWELRVKEERVNFLTHLLTGDPIKSKTSIGNDQNRTGFELLDGKPRPKELIVPQKKRGDSGDQSLESPTSKKDGSPRSQNDPDSPVVKNKGFFDKIHEHAMRLKDKEKVHVAKRFGKDLEESAEDSISDAEINNPIDPEYSVHSIHDSVAAKYDLKSEEHLKLEDKMALIIQKAYKSRLSRKDFTLRKEFTILENLPVVGRLFRKIEYRKSFNQNESLVNFVITFRIEKKFSRLQEAAGKRMLDLDGNTDFADPTKLAPVLHISLRNKRNFLLNCMKVIDIERFMVDRTTRNIDNLLTLPRLQQLCRTLAENMYVVDEDVHFHQSLTIMINSPVELELGTQHERSTDNEDGRDAYVTDDSQDPDHHRKVVDGCVFDYSSPAKLDVSLDDKTLRGEELAKTRLMKIKMIQRNVRAWLERERAFFMGDGVQGKRRQILYSGLAKKDSHYVNVVCLINNDKNSRAEVHAFDFNQLAKLTPLMLEPKVLYTNDLSVPEIFRKIELDFIDNKVGITEFNKYQMKQDRIMEDIYCIDKYQLDLFAKAQAMAKRVVQKRHFSFIKKAAVNYKFSNKQQIVLDRFYKIYKQQSFLMLIEKPKFESKLVITAKRQRGGDAAKVKIEPLELFSNHFKEKAESELMHTNHELETYIMDMKARIRFEEDPDVPGGLLLKLDFGKLEDELEVKDSKAMLDLQNKEKINSNQADAYQLFYEQFTRKLLEADLDLYYEPTDTKKELKDQEEASKKELKNKLYAIPTSIAIDLKKSKTDDRDPIRSEKEKRNQLDLFEDDYIVTKRIVQRYFSYNFNRNRLQSVNKKIQIEKELKGIRSQEETFDEGRPSFESSETLVELLSIHLATPTKAKIEATFYYDICYNDIVFKYWVKGPKDAKDVKWEQATLEELELNSRDTEDMKEELPGKIRTCLLVDSSSKITIKNREKKTSDGQGSSKLATLTLLKHHHKEESIVHSKRTIPDDDDSEELAVLQEDNKDLERIKKRVVSCLRNYTLIKKIKVVSYY